MALAEAREAALNRLVSWCQSKDPEFFIKGDSVKAVLDIRGDVRLVATQDIAAKATLAIVPHSLALSAGTVTHAARLEKDYKEIEDKIRELYKGRLVDGDGEAFQPVGEWAGLGRGGIITKEARSMVQEYRLALALALELASMERGGSVWQPYLETLPTSVSAPIFDFSKEAMSACRGTYFHDLLCSEREDYELMMKAVVRPILARHQPSFPYQDLESAFKRAFALQLSRGFEAMDGSSVLLPVVDCLNGQVEGGGHNVCMVGGCQLVTSRPVDKGEQLFLNYGRKDNNAFLLSYGHLDDRMVFGNAAHRVCLSFRHLFPLDGRFGDDTLRRRKLEFLNQHCALGYWQATYWSNLWMGPTQPQGPGEEEKKAAAMMVPTALRLFSLVLGLRDLKSLLAIEASGRFEVDGGNCDLQLAGRVQLGVIDHLLDRLGKSTLSEDVAGLMGHAKEGGGGGKGEEEDVWRARRVVAGDKNLLLRARREVCREHGWANERDGEVYEKVCDHCGTFVNARRCAHCGVAYYCSRRCQRATWKVHKHVRPREDGKPSAEEAPSA